MNLKISQDQIRYKIDGNKVTATIINCKYMLSNFSDTFTSVYPTRSELYLKNSYSGSVICDPEDTFNEAVGKRIAVAKAIKYLREDAYKVYKTWMDKVSNSMNNALDRLDYDKKFSQKKSRNLMVANGVIYDKKEG